jgi:hypothetical protein
MRMSRVALFIRLALLVLVGGLAVHIADAPVLADGCHDACESAFNSCTLSATTAYNSCAYSADSALSSCESAADEDFEDNVNIICGGWTQTACIQMMENIRNEKYASCNGIYIDNISICTNNEAGADAICSANFDSCVGNCP